MNRQENIQSNINNYINHDITEKPIILDESMLGKGSFGNVYVAYDNNNNKIALKIEEINNKQLTLMKEFKICLKFYVINIKLKKMLELNNLKKNLKEHTKEYLKITKYIEKLDNDEIIRIYNYITDKNLLVVPKEFNINYMLTHDCVAHTFSCYSCMEYNILTMKLYGKNLEYITDNYYLTENGKYFLAYKLLHNMSCVHRCGIIHRDIKLANFVLNNDCELSNSDDVNKLYPTIIDFGLATDLYKCENESINYVQPKKTNKLFGTLRYISLNIHAYNSPTIIDDLISLCYTLIVICTNKSLPWMGHLKDENAFDSTKHTYENCKCNYHNNIIKNKTKNRNTIAEIKFHVSYEDLIGTEYMFIIKWLKYLYSLKSKQMPSYEHMFKILCNNVTDKNLNINNLCFEILKKKDKTK